jgi:MFS transporter, DHA1 family, tetracycline resistance protein
MLRNADPRSATAHWTLWFIVFVDLVGFGILTPLIPFYVLRTGVPVEAVTLIVAAYSLFQFIAMPFWGHVSDKLGRRIVLLVSMAGHAASWVLLAYADTWQMLLLARILGGVTSANLVTAYAYVTDVTGPEDRAKYMGRISAAFGLGFVIGPALGGLLAGSGSVMEANLERPALAAAALSIASFIGIWFFLPESHKPGVRAANDPPPPSFFQGVARVAHRPVIRAMIFLCLIVVTFVSAREAILAIWAHDRLAMDAKQIGLLLTVSGATVSGIQFFAMGPLSRRFGQLALVKAAVVLFAVGWISMLFATQWVHVAMATVLSSIATAFFQTNLQSLISLRAGGQERGLVLGVFQGSNALARFGGQATSGFMFAHIGQNAPMVIGAIMMLPALLLLVWIGRRLNPSAPAAHATPAE